MAAMNFTSPNPIASRGKVRDSTSAERYGSDSGSSTSSPMRKALGERRISPDT